ncbi:MAG: IS66 family transposase [bacterium]
MTKEEAIVLYRSGEEPTVKKLIELDTRVEELEKVLEEKQHPMGTQNDPSTPSGMRPAYEKPSSKGRKKKPGRKKGHEGVRRAAPSVIHESKHHTLTQCPQCLSPLAEPVSSRTRFTEDIPKVEPLVTKHIIDICYCPKCDKIVEAPVEDALPKSTLGIGLLVQTAYLHFYMGLPLRQIVTYLNACLYFQVSAGGLALAWQRLARILFPWYQHLGMLAKTSTLLQVDETGWRVGGKPYWLWCFTSQKIKIAYYLISPSRASPVLKQVLGEFFHGILLCDFFGAYNKIGAFLKQRCLLHLLRDMKRTSVFHQSPEWMAFSKRLKRLIKDALRLSVRRPQLIPQVYTRRCCGISQRLADLIAQPYQDKHCRRLVKRLKRHQNELFTFLQYPEVPANNNHTERMIRPAVIIRKNSYCNHSQKGADTQAILMSIFRTLHLRDQDAIVILEEALKTYCRNGSLPPLIDYSEVKTSLAA